MGKALLAFLGILAVVGGTLGFFWQSSSARRARAATGAGPNKNDAAQTVARRVVCLVSLVIRAKAEQELHRTAVNQASNRLAQSQREWLEGKGLWEVASERERQLFRKSMGTWAVQDIADGQWREESMMVLLWAMQAGSNLPPYDTVASESELTNSVPTPDQVDRFIAGATLRSQAEIQKARDIAEFWLWRARTTQLEKEGTKLPKNMTFEQIIHKSAKKGEEDGLFKAIDGDFPAFGKAYAKLSDDEWHQVMSIAMERLYALNWLCGYATDWDKVPTET